MIPIPATVKLVVGLVLVGGIAALQALAKVEPAWTWAGGVVQMLTMLELFFTVPPSASAKLAKLAPTAVACLCLVAFAALCAGCLSSAPIVPVTAANSAQVSSCESTATLHNDLVVGDFVLTGGAAGLGTVGALVSDSQGKTDLAVAAAGAAGVALVASSLIELTASNFANSQCSSVVGPLPVAPPLAPVVAADGGAK